MVAEQGIPEKPLPGIPASACQAGSVCRQYLLAARVNLAMFAAGYALGWSSPICYTLTDYKMINTPLSYALTVEETSSMTSALALGGIFGSIIAGVLMSNFGRKRTLIFGSLPFYIGWYLIMLSSGMIQMSIGRAIVGFGCGVIFTTLPVYTAEISTEDVRKSIGCLQQVFLTLGLLTVYITGSYTTFQTTAFCGMWSMILFNVLFAFAPETPYYYCFKDKREDAAASLSMIRTRTHKEVEVELNKIINDIEPLPSIIIDQVTYSPADCNRKSLFLCIDLAVLQQATGICAVTFYLHDIVHTSNINTPTPLAVSYITMVQLCAMLITFLFADKISTRFLFTFSTIFSFVGQFMMGSYLYGINSGWKDYFLLPIDAVCYWSLIAMVIYVVGYAGGIGAISLTLVSEMFPMRYKARGMAMTNGCFWLAIYLITRYFMIVEMHYGFWIFSACCLVFLYLIFQLPETRGKSFHQIQTDLFSRHIQILQNRALEDNTECF